MSKQRFDRLFVVVAFLVTFLVILGVQQIGARPAPAQGFDFSWRQGGDPGNWSEGGTANYPVTAGTIQAGAGHIDPNALFVVVTFPEPYQAAPLVVVQEIGRQVVHVTTVSPTGFVAEVDGPELPGVTVVFDWMAVGE